MANPKFTKKDRNNMYYCSFIEGLRAKLEKEVDREESVYMITLVVLLYQLGMTNDAFFLKNPKLTHVKVTPCGTIIYVKAKNNSKVYKVDMDDIEVEERCKFTRAAIDNK